MLTVQVMVYGLPIGTCSFKPGFAIGFPLGPETGVVYALARETNAAATVAKNDAFILILEKFVIFLIYFFRRKKGV